MPATTAYWWCGALVPPAGVLSRPRRGRTDACHHTTCHTRQATPSPVRRAPYPYVPGQPLPVAGGACVGARGARGRGSSVSWSWQVRPLALDPRARVGCRRRAGYALRWGSRRQCPAPPLRSGPGRLIVSAAPRVSEAGWPTCWLTLVAIYSY